MRLLAFDTSTEHLSVAVASDQTGQQRLWEFEGVGGAQSSAQLIPVVMQLLKEASLSLQQLDAIVFGQGPGSFTGLRTACSVAQGLAFGAGVPVLPVATLMAVVEQARHTYLPLASACRVQAMLDARMGEVYVASFDYQDGRWLRRAPDELCSPKQLDFYAGASLAGNVFEIYAAELSPPQGTPCWTARPTAQALLRLAPALLQQGLALPATQAYPLYIRDKVAQTTEEREAQLRRTST